jgi:hypothetical protein
MVTGIAFFLMMVVQSSHVDQPERGHRIAAATENNECEYFEAEMSHMSEGTVTVAALGREGCMRWDRCWKQRV